MKTIYVKTLVLSSLRGLAILLFILPESTFSQQKIEWERYIDLNKKESRKVSPTTALVRFDGTRRELNRLGINVFRRLDEQHYIIAKPSPNVKDAFESIYDANNLWKLDDRLLQKYVRGESIAGHVSLVVSDPAKFIREINLLNINYELKYKYSDIIQIIIKNNISFEKLLSISSITTINLTPVMPTLEAPLRDFNNNVNQINRIRHENPPRLE